MCLKKRTCTNSDVQIMAQKTLVIDYLLPLKKKALEKKIKEKGIKKKQEKS